MITSDEGDKSGRCGLLQNAAAHVEDGALLGLVLVGVLPLLDNGRTAGLC